MGFLKKLKNKIEEKILKKPKEDEVVEKLKEAKIDTYKKGLKKTKKSVVRKLKKLSTEKLPLDDNYFERLEEILIEADINYDTTKKIILGVKKRIVKNKAKDSSEVSDFIFEEIYDLYGKTDTTLHLKDKGLSVILVVGVNGVGKTTSIAKIANMLIKDGKKVHLAAGDTFRAGAVQQLGVWAERLNISITKPQKEGQDPASVVYTSIEEALKNNSDVLICDTAGRLQSKVNLMKELEKINNIISKKVEGGTSETLLVIDATTGQNAISQAQGFNEVTKLTGIILTKLDGTAKGGIIISVKDIVDIPVKYIGLGEKIDDLQPFKLDEYIYSLTEDFDKPLEEDED